MYIWYMCVYIHSIHFLIGKLILEKILETPPTTTIHKKIHAEICRRIQGAKTNMSSQPTSINPSIFVSSSLEHSSTSSRSWGKKTVGEAFFIFGSLALKSKIDVRVMRFFFKLPQGVQPPLLSLPQSFPLHEKKGSPTNHWMKPFF